MGKDNGWIGVDFDGTLAEHNSPQSIELGAPIPRMWQRVRRMLDKGWTVKIMTARANEPHEVERVQAWLRRHNLPVLEVTATKDYGMIALFDDRAISVDPDTGRAATINNSIRNILGV